MSARGNLPAAPAETAQDLADKHDRLIVRCKQLCRPIRHEGTRKFIAGFCHHKGDAEMTVYLEGVRDPVRPCDITILENANE
jgi:hypothetical protein